MKHMWKHIQNMQHHKQNQSMITLTINKLSNSQVIQYILEYIAEFFFRKKSAIFGTFGIIGTFGDLGTNINFFVQK